MKIVCQTSPRIFIFESGYMYKGKLKKKGLQTDKVYDMAYF
jgi:hypothetical protein